MNKKTIAILEYEKIIQRLAEAAGAEMTRAKIKEIVPMTDPYDIQDGLDETEEAARLIVHKGPLPVGNFYDIAPMIRFAQKGGSLSMAELLKVRYNLQAARNCGNFLKGDTPELPLLQSLGDVLAVYKNVEDEIDRCILTEDEMSDNASPELKSIRRQIARQNEALRSKIDHLINRHENRSFLQDAIVTIRDGRYVVPVKAEHKNMVPGIVHDQSGSGATLFIEPQAVVELNNQLRQLAAEEQAEIARILQELSERCTEHHEGIINNQDVLVHLDFINAKGRLALSMDAEKPVLSGEINPVTGTLVGERLLELKKARHPLIDPAKVVPIDVKIGGGGKNDWNALIITGPNTGGKTVTLKTCGLLAMMAQTGLHIPALAGSKIPIYEDIFADIGDEQSIEQSLSTFSSHMKNIVDICARADEGCLVLLDELGAGTDPAEGAALAIAILEDIIDKGASVLATTHYTELKKYAITKEGVQNASMQFDVETLSPTFKLLVGIPGKSNAFEISQKLGLDGAVIGKARHLMESGDMEFEDVLTAIEKDRKTAEEERDKALVLNLEMKRLKEEAAAERRKIEKEKDQILNEAKRQAREIIGEAKELSLDIQEELKELAKAESMGERNKRFDNSRRRIKDAAGRYKEQYTKEINDNPVKVEDLKVGDWIKVVTLQQNGEVMALPDNKGELTIKVGTMKVKVKSQDLMIIPDGRSKKRVVTDMSKKIASHAGMKRAKTMTIRPEVDVRGQRMEEGLENAMKYLDDALMAGLHEVKIIHGRGEGILQKAIREELKKHKHVKEFHRAEYNDGGDGVTVVVLK